MVESLSWGIIGTGGIAADFVEALGSSKRCRVVSVAGSSAEKARAFAERWRLPRAAASVDELLRDPAVEAVYVASPHPRHEAHAIQCLTAGKHVLCEKPLTVDAASTQRVIAMASQRRTFLMEALMYRCHPLIGELITRVRGGAIGKPIHVRADFGFRAPRQPEGRLFNPSLGGGGILDVGPYPVSFARLVAGLVEGRPFAEPDQLTAWGHVGPTGADELAGALLTFSSGMTAEVSCAVFHALGTSATVFGEHGSIVLPNPWIPGGQRQGLETELIVHVDGQDVETVKVRTDKPIYAIEAELVAETLPEVEARWPAMSWNDTLGNMRVMDAWRAALASPPRPE